MLILSSPSLITLRNEVYHAHGAGDFPNVSATLSNARAGSLLIILAAGYQSWSVGNDAVVTADNGTLFFQASQTAYVTDGVAHGSCGIWYGINATDGNVSVTVTFGLHQWAPMIGIYEWDGASPVAVSIGIGNTAELYNTANPQITTNGVTTQANQLVVSCMAPMGAIFSIGPNQIEIRGSFAYYQNETPVNSPVTHTFDLTAVARVQPLVIAAFKRR